MPEKDKGNESPYEPTKEDQDSDAASAASFVSTDHEENKISELQVVKKS